MTIAEACWKCNEVHIQVNLGITTSIRFYLRWSTFGQKLTAGKRYFGQSELEATQFPDEFSFSPEGESNVKLFGFEGLSFYFKHDAKHAT